ncbi:hypothetical protein [Microlunatus ginsengisoli]|uniref:SnoaL-like domain-containing protein n=1 Tax=Microlunatus ginsengisoli TaxID=363863 RepID=A0ABP7AWM4_9ACTN
MTAVREQPVLDEQLSAVAAALVRWLETGEQQHSLFAPDVLADLSLPHWRLQTDGADATYRLRRDEHPFPGAVRVEALDRTSRGFLIQFEERWRAEDQDWYCRELIHCAVGEGRITELTVYCTGDWDETVQRRHAEQVRLIRP